MNLLNGNFTTFDGEPVIGRMPARLVVTGGVALTSEQKGGVAHAYKLFCDAVRVSTVGYHVQHRILADGTKVRMVANRGLSDSGASTDQVFAEPPPAPTTGKVGALEDILIGVMPDVFTGYSSTAKFSCTARAGNVAPTSLRTARLLEDGPAMRQHPGSMDWFNPDLKAYRKPILVSWYGPLARYGTAEYIGRGAQGDAMQSPTMMTKARGGAAWADQAEYFNSAKAAVWLNGIRFTVKKADLTPVLVLSAALRRVGGVLTLYLTTKDTKLAVYSGPVGKIDVKGGNITVAKLFDIDYTPDTTGWKYLPGVAPASDQFPQWVGPIQPLYFNQSCTQCAGLVTFKTADALTGSYVTQVKLITVDVDAQTTTFDMSHALKQSTIVQSAVSGYTAADVAANGGSTSQPGLYQALMTRLGGDATINSSVTNTVVERRYGGVDWDGDTMRIAMVEQTTILAESRNMDGSWDLNGTGYPGASNAMSGVAGVGPYPRIGSNTITAHAQTTTTMSLESSWRVYIHGGATLAHRDNTLALSGTATYAVNSQVTRTDHEDFLGDATHNDYSGPGGSDGGSTWAESSSGPFYWFVTLEGGDLRRNCVNVLELVELGTSTYAATIAPFVQANLATEALTLSNGTWNFFFGYLFAHSGSGAMTITDVTDVKSRYMVTRGSGWVSDSEILTAENPVARALYANQRTQFGWKRLYATLWPAGGWAGIEPCPLDSLGWIAANPPTDADSAGYTSTTSIAQCEIGPSHAFDISITGSTLPITSLERNRYIAGFAALSSCAFNREGTLAYLAMGAAGSTPGSQHAQEAVWIVAGTPASAFSYTSGAWTYGGTVTSGVLTLSTPPKFLLVAPLFIDNVPKD